MITQAELTFSDDADDETDPAVALGIGQIETLLRAAALRGMPWVSCGQLVNEAQAALGVVWTARKVRTFASASLAVASAPGSAGYALASALDAAALQHVADALISAARKMLRRGLRLRRAAGAKFAAEKLTAPLPSAADAELAEYLAGGAH